MTGCWLWEGAVSSDGYGSISVSGKSAWAHRVSYTVFRGEIPTGLTIDHICRVRCCVNPAHLRVLTMRENTLCGVSKKGHPSFEPLVLAGVDVTINGRMRALAEGSE